MAKKDSDMSIKLTQNLRILRLLNGYTQQNLADALYINRSTYTYYETGKTRPGLEALQQLARLYNVTLEEVLNKEAQAAPYGIYPKKVRKENPRNICELSAGERSLIVKLRMMEEKERLKWFASRGGI